MPLSLTIHYGDAAEDDKPCANPSWLPMEDAQPVIAYIISLAPRWFAVDLDLADLDHITSPFGRELVPTRKDRQ